ncbi:MAG: hypothetical protein ACRDHU_02055 [Actinomycetota bacterium]
MAASAPPPLKALVVEVVTLPEAERDDRIRQIAANERMRPVAELLWELAHNPTAASLVLAAILST